MRYHNITTDDMLNGDGLRTVLWVAGCEHHCPHCQNPVTWDINDGILFDVNAIIELIEKIKPSYISGVTFSGGDPLHPKNRDTITTLAEFIRILYPNKTIWLYTGYAWEDIKDLEIMQYLDVLVDGPFIESLKDATLKWKGSSNQRVINVPATLESGEVILHA